MSYEAVALLKTLVILSAIGVFFVILKHRLDRLEAKLEAMQKDIGERLDRCGLNAGAPPGQSAPPASLRRFSE